MENIKIEVALEIISMCIAIAVENKNSDKIISLNKEKEQIYEGNQEVIDKVISQYGKKVKEQLEV